MVVVVVNVAGQVPPVGHAQQDSEVNAPTLRAAISAVLPADAAHPDERVSRVSITSTGDLTVVFALRDIDDDPALIGAAGAADTLSILQGIYASNESLQGQIASATVLGTYAAYGKSERLAHRPLLRVVLSAAHADRIQNASLSPSQLPSWADDWWAFDDLRAGMGGRLTNAPAAWPDLRRRIEVMLVHLNEALFALAGQDVRIARSQFKQFFDAWDQVDDEILKPQYAERYANLDLALNGVELALLHSQPEDVDGARVGLRVLRNGVRELADQLDSELSTSTGFS